MYISDQENYIVMEFDYFQNLPLPKIPCSKIYYSRQLYLYLFNIHIYNNYDNSPNEIFFHSIEGELSKNANSVCSNLYPVILSYWHYNRISNKTLILLSDNTGGQNKNWTMVKFLSSISIKFNIKIIHLFPVRGHTFSQCDRNFGLIGKPAKRVDKIEIPDQYLDLLSEQ